LAHTLFPVGDLPKPEVRTLAKKFGLPTATKKDSQGLCFMGAIDMKEFLAHFVPQQKGVVLDVTGTVVGEHDGSLFYTIGQRHGFRLHNKNTDRTEMYVVAKGIEHNTITVGSEIILDTRRITLKDVNEIVPIADGTYDAQIRYHGTVHKVTVQQQNDDTLAVEGLAEQPAAGQSVVLYKGDECVGGGIVA
jgi:tRNA-specific 2-thiouridylase